MNYRQATILAGSDVDAAGTKDMEIKIKDIISRITIDFAVTKSKHGMDSYRHNNITKVELKGDGEVLFSMNGGQIQALNIYDRKCPTLNGDACMSGVAERASYGLDFGRYLFDPQLGLDPKQWNSLILYVTYDENVSDTGVTANEMNVWADVFDEKIVTPMGFLRGYQHDSRTPPSSGYDYITIPTDKTIRKMLVQGYRAQYHPYYQITEVRLDEDNEKRIVFDWDLDDYYQVMKGIWTPVRENIMGIIGGGGDFVYYCTPTNYFGLMLAMGVGSACYGYVDTWQKGGYFVPYASGASQPFVQAKVEGLLPNHCFEFPFGNPMEVDDWYAVRPEMDLRLRIKAGSGGASGTIATVLQQLQRY